MKKIIKVTLFLSLVLGMMFASYIAFSNKESNEGFRLSMLYSMNQAFAEDTVTKVKVVSKYQEEITLPDGSKTIAWVLGCAGTGDIECKL